MKKFFKTKKVFGIAFVFALAMTFAVLFGGSSVQASDVLVDVRVKADVPEKFTGTISLNYVGMESDGFTVILTKEENYSTVVSIPRDLYTFKSESVPDGYTIKASKNFTVEDVELNTVYLLPVIVSEQTSISNNTASYINVKITADPKNDVELMGSFDVSYSGTNGNAFIATLCAENGYTVEMPISKDLYTLKSTSVSAKYEDSFVLDALYSFNCVDAKDDEKYLLPVKVYSKEDAPKKTAKEERVAKEIMVKAMLPSKIDYAGTITVVYRGAEGSVFEATLNEKNAYQQTLYAYLDNYSLSYAVSYDTKVYSFTGQPSFLVTESTDYLEVPIYIMKDGVILTDANFGVEEEPEDVPEPVVEENGNDPIMVILILALIGVGAFFVYIKFFKSKNEEYDEEEEDAFLEDEEVETDNEEHEMADLDN